MTQSNEKRQFILEAATDLFAHYGYAKTSLDDIARGARIAKATIYYYFPSKEELFLEAIRAKVEDFFLALRSEIDAAEDFEEKLSRFLHLPMMYIFNLMPILAEAMKQLPPSYVQEMEPNRLDYRGRMNGLLQEIMDYGRKQGIINDEIDSLRFSEIINDWFLLGDSCFDLTDKERFIQRIERDHELIIQLLLYGIIKRKK